MTYTKQERLDPTENMDPVQSNEWKNINLSQVPYQTGVAGEDLFETKVPFNQVPCEKVIEGKNDSYIVLGRDRFGSELQGKGMEGQARCSSIDIVVGRQGGKIPEKNAEGKYNALDPNFTTDAARIYISQRTDIDDYFSITDGNIGNFKDRSAIALKADGIRLVAREGIKLVTKIDPKNSLDMKTGTYGIDLIALNNDTDLQSIPKGENLAIAFKRLLHHVKDLNKIVKGFLSYQMKFNSVVQSHVHVSPFWGDDTSPSIQLEVIDGPIILKDLEEKINSSLNKNMKNLVSHQLTYLEKSGDKYINSSYNKTN